MRRGSNLGQLGGFNQAVILDSIRRAADGVSRTELAQSTGLTTQTVSNIARRLLDQRLIREDRTTSSGPENPGSCSNWKAARSTRPASTSTRR